MSVNLVGGASSASAALIALQAQMARDVKALSDDQRQMQEVVSQGRGTVAMDQVAVSLTSARTASIGSAVVATATAAHPAAAVPAAHPAVAPASDLSTSTKLTKPLYL